MGGWFLIGAWLLHYIPFFGMHRSLYLHHYLPAYMFSAMATGLFVDYLGRRWRGWRLLLGLYPALGLLSLAVIGTFSYFSPITFGTEIATDTLNAQRKWISTWDWP